MKFQTTICICSQRINWIHPVVLECPKCGRKHNCGGDPFPLGLGDSIAVVVNLCGGRSIKRIWKWWTGKECGCASRQKWINRKFGWVADWLRVASK